jgi:hypothetical protein
MLKKDYHESLARLQAELKTAKLDEHPGKEAALELAQDVQSILEHPGEVPFAHHYRLMGRLRDALDRFEASHPSLTEALSRVIDTLNNMGI